jgi:molybdopterin synthase sulfur carrier subunit
MPWLRVGVAAIAFRRGWLAINARLLQYGWIGNRRSPASSSERNIMSIRVRIPSPLRSYTNGVDAIETDGGTVGEVLNNLKSQASGIETRLFKGPTQLNRFVNVYLNDEDIRFLQNLDTPVKEGDEVSIVPAIAGGAI